MSIINDMLMTTPTDQWTYELVTTKLAQSPAWVARAVYRLCEDHKELAAGSTDPAQRRDDHVYFENLMSFFREHGYFTDRHIAVARRKIRPSYIMYLVKLANS